jgi:hypothetical protein
VRLDWLILAIEECLQSKNRNESATPYQEGAQLAARNCVLESARGKAGLFGSPL